MRNLDDIISVNNFSNIEIREYKSDNQCNKNNYSLKKNYSSIKSYSHIFNPQYLGNNAIDSSIIEGKSLNSNSEYKLYSEHPSTSIPIVTNFDTIFKVSKNNESNNENTNDNNIYNEKNNNNNSKENTILNNRIYYNRIFAPHIIKSSFNIYEDLNQNNTKENNDTNQIESDVFKSSFNNYEILNSLDYSFENVNNTEQKTKNENKIKLKNIRKSNLVTKNDHIYKPQITIQCKESTLDDNIDRYITEDNQSYNINEKKIRHSKRINKLELQKYHKRRSSNYLNYDSIEMSYNTTSIMKKMESEYSINDYRNDEENHDALNCYYPNTEYNEIKENSIKEYIYDSNNFISDYEKSNQSQAEYIKNNNFDDEYLLFYDEENIPIDKIKSFISTESLKDSKTLERNPDISQKEKSEKSSVNENNSQLKIKNLNNDKNQYKKITIYNDDNKDIKTKRKNNCEFCNKKLRITATYKCKCSKIFCAAHRYSECHNCTYDYKQQGIKDLKKNNPLVVKDKVTKF
ncbi:hypothetical protein U3516DRAFT_539842 [Neocallimastix sp. 'constans']